MSLPTDPKARKDIPIYSGFIKYFPLAIAAVAELSRKGNDQHNPGKPLHWDRSKSGDELDAQMRHVLDYAADVPVDTDGVLHLTKNAWRAMAQLQKVLEAARVPVSNVQEPGEDGWIEWDGGGLTPRDEHKIPSHLNGDTKVTVRLRGGPCVTREARTFYWWHSSGDIAASSSDIVAYRVVA